METWGHEVTPFTVTNTSKEFVVCFAVCPSPQVKFSTADEEEQEEVKVGEVGGVFVWLVMRLAKGSGAHYCPKTTLYHVLHQSFFFLPQKVGHILLNCPLSFTSEKIQLPRSLLS